MDRHKVAPGLILVLIFPLLPVVKGEAGVTCPAGDYVSKAGVCCNKCAQGFKLAAECKAKDQRSNCVECPEGQFSEHLNYSPTCQACRRCKASKNEVEVSKCTTSKNTVCNCKEGYFKSWFTPSAYNCLPCSSCRDNEELKQGCTPDRNTVCECKPGFYTVKRKCERCDGCGDDCPEQCPKAVIKATTAHPGTRSIVNEICIGTLAGLLVLMIVLVTYFATKKSSSRSSSHGEPLDASDTKVMLPPGDTLQKVQVFSQEVMEAQPPSITEAVPLGSEPAQPTSNLPDCVPLEVKTHEVIYMVLDKVPVPKVKQLVRLLGVSEIAIEQAEVDWRHCREAHYQMLKTWTESSWVDGRRCQVLNRQLLQDLIRTLREIHLVPAAEALEAKYNVQ